MTVFIQYTMMKIARLALALLLVCQVTAQQKITVEDIYTGAFRAKGMDALSSLKNSNRYTVLNFDRATRSTSIDLYDFATLKKLSTIISTKDHSDLASIEGYVFNKAEDKLLISNNSQPIYRHSSTADYFLYDMATQKLTRVLDQAQEPVFSPDGTKIAYAKENNLFVLDIASNTTTQITTDGQKNAIVNGITDWVY